MCRTVLFISQVQTKVPACLLWFPLFVCSLKLNIEHLSNAQLHSFPDSIKLSSHVEDTVRGMMVITAAQQELKPTSHMTELVDIKSPQ